MGVFTPYNPPPYTPLDAFNDSPTAQVAAIVGAGAGATALILIVGPILLDAEAAAASAEEQAAIEFGQPEATIQQPLDPADGTPTYQPPTPPQSGNAPPFRGPVSWPPTGFH
jgi:hypothetical protein